MALDLSVASRWLGVAALALAGCCFGGGCASTPVDQPHRQQAAAQDPADPLEFWHGLADAPVITNHQMLGAALRYADADTAIPVDYQDRMAAAQSRGLLPAAFNEKAEAAASRGTIAVILTRSLGIEGGLMMRLSKDSPRYATREMQYLDLYPVSSPQQTFSGIELLEVFSKVEDYQLREAAPAPPAASQPVASKTAPLVSFSRTALVRLIAAWIASPRWLAQAAPAPAPENPAAGDQAVSVRVAAVRGLVQVRLAEDQPWRKAEAGEPVPLGAEFRTGPRSSVQLDIAGRQTVTLDRLGVIKVLDVVQRGGAINTDVGMKYGRTAMEVQAAGIEHQSQIRSPSATLAVRGSLGVLEDVGHTLRAVGREGDVAWARGMGDLIALPPGSEHLQDNASTGETRLSQSIIDPAAHASTQDERRLFGRLPARFQNRFANVDHVQRLLRTVAIGDFPAVGGLLNVVVIFRSSGSGPTDVDLRLRTPYNAVVGPNQPDRLRFFFHTGDARSHGPNHVVFEAVRSTAPILPEGDYQGVVTNQGPAPADVLVEVLFRRRPGDEPNLIGSQPVILPPQQNQPFSFSIPPGSIEP